MQPIKQILANSHTSPELKQALTEVVQIRAFASQELSLPNNHSYLYYADLKRRYVVWNVFATPAYSLQPKQWCFPIAGWVSYRGYFAETAAKTLADELRAEGYDVYTSGVEAYSTLGWLDDPVLNTMLDWSTTQLAGLIFHELAHQQVYIPNDTAFNEGFAVTVEEEGIKRWLARHGIANEIAAYQQAEQRHQEFIQLLLTTRNSLETLYQQPLPPSAMAIAKQQTFANLLHKYAELKKQWHGYSGYDQWMSTDLNNAKLLSVVTYHNWVPAFQTLLTNLNGDLANFYQQVAKIGKLPIEERRLFLEKLLIKP
jgi:predicted aminopeptidase